jgi:hypothetical protein
MPSFTAFLITFCIGVAATLGWQSYGDAAREMIASSYPQLGWLAPKPAPNTQSAPETIALAAPDATSPDQPQLEALSHDLDAVRQSVEGIAASQEQITRSVDKIAASQEQMTRGFDRIAAGQEQMTREITKLQEIERYVLYRNSEPSPPPAPAPTPAAARSRAPRPSPTPPTPAPAPNP